MSAPVEPKTALGAWLRAARLARGWTQEHLAERLTAALGRPVVRPEISRWEAGKHPPAAGTLRILEQVLKSRHEGEK